LRRVLVQESGKHGWRRIGPVARDIIKAYYDKKNKKINGTVTAGEPLPTPASRAAVVAPVVAIKPPNLPLYALADADKQDPQ